MTVNKQIGGILFCLEKVNLQQYISGTQFFLFNSRTLVCHQRERWSRVVVNKQINKVSVFK